MVGFCVVDVWESPETFEEFGRVLMPIVQEVGFEPPEPSVWSAENVIGP